MTILKSALGFKSLHLGLPKSKLPFGHPPSRAFDMAHLLDGKKSTISLATTGANGMAYRQITGQMARLPYKENSVILIKNKKAESRRFMAVKGTKHG